MQSIITGVAWVLSDRAVLILEVSGEETMLLYIFFLLSLFLTFIDNGSAGITSAFIRTQFPSVDIPLENEVLSVPNGYNAPQQVSLQS